MLLYGTGGGGWWRGPKSEPPIGGVRSFRLALWPALLTTLLTGNVPACVPGARSCACLAASRPSEMSRMSSTTRILVTPSSTRQSTRRAWSWQTQWPTASPAPASHASPRGLPFCKHKGHEARRRGHGCDPRACWRRRGRSRGQLHFVHAFVQLCPMPLSALSWHKLYICRFGCTSVVPDIFWVR